MSKDFKHLDLKYEVIALINAITSMDDWRLIDMHPQETIVFMNERNHVPPVVKYNEKWFYSVYPEESIVIIFTCNGKDDPEPYVPNYGIAIWIPHNRLVLNSLEVKLPKEDKAVQWKPKTEG